MNIEDEIKELWKRAFHELIEAGKRSELARVYAFFCLVRVLRELEEDLRAIHQQVTALKAKQPLLTPTAFPAGSGVQLTWRTRCRCPD
jgi:hypothetical protein